MKLGVAYNVFDGEELLEYSINSIRNNVDYISVIYQEYSYQGIKCADNLLEFITDLKNKGLVDDIVLFEPDLSNKEGDNPSINESKKRNLGLQMSRKNGCTHHMSMDTDEFYEDSQFKYMKYVMESGNFGTGCTQHCQYYKDSIYILTNKENEYVTTIEKITDKTEYIHGLEFPLAVDPSRKTNNMQNGENVYGFIRNEVEMHHMSFVRKDIRKKLTNSSSRRWFSDERIDSVESHYMNWKYPEPAMWACGRLLPITEVPRLFKIYDVK